jgi:hypothetical protein
MYDYLNITSGKKRDFGFDSTSIRASLREADRVLFRIYGRSRRRTAAGW